MDELRKAVSGLAEEARAIERQLAACEDPPSKSQLSNLQRSVELASTFRRALSGDCGLTAGIGLQKRLSPGLGRLVSWLKRAQVRS
jgi:hypothetical protein